MYKTLTTLLFSFLTLPLFSQGIFNFDKLSPRLTTALIQHGQPYYKVVIVMADKVDIEELDASLYARKASLQERTYEVITLLQAKAAATQPPVLSTLLQDPHVIHSSIQPIWIANMITAEMKEDVISTLSYRNDIEWIDIDGEVKLDPFRRENNETSPTRTVGGREKGLTAIHAPDMWAMGYTGNGTVAMSIDTGVDPTHPSIDDQFRGNYVPASWAWYESNNSNTNPFDCDQHGTHTVGTMIGLDEETHDTIGVAFGATWIASPGIGSCASTNKYLAFQWAIDPDNNPNTTIDQPHVINNSWYDPAATNECTTNYYRNLFSAVEAAGIAIVFSAGNNGPGVSTITNPKNINTGIVNTFTVANVNGNLANFPINSSSSRGPSICGGTGSLLIKPEVSAPGTNVRSSIPGGAYANFTGTSMAAPHAAGAILLLKEAFPALTGIQIKEALYFSAVDLGIAGEDNDYGMGMIHVKAAYDYLVAAGFVPSPPINQNNMGAVNILNIEPVTCSQYIFPVVTIANYGLDTLTSADIAYQFSNGGPGDTITWNGFLLPNTSQVTFLPTQSLPVGNYTLAVTILLPNGMADDIPQNNSTNYSFAVIPSNTPTTSNGLTICQGGNALLSAQASSAGTIQWFTQLNGGVPVGTGSPWLTPPLTTNTTYYSDIVNTKFGGKLDNTGAGQFDDLADVYLVFDCLSKFLLKNVTIYAETAGNGTIELRKPDGTVLQAQTVNFGAGKQIIPLNFEVPTGINYQLAINTTVKLYRNDNPSYPYTIPNILSLKTSNIGILRYYYLYNWELEYGTSCGRGFANISVVPGNLQANFSATPTVVNLGNTGLVQFNDLTANATQWNWNLGNNIQSTQQSPSYIYTNAGNYLVTLTAGNGACTDADTMTLVVTGVLDIEENFAENIRLYPNPTRDWLNFSYEGDLPPNIQIQILDVIGREIYAIQFLQNEIKVSFADLPEGIYFVRVLDGNKQLLAKRVVKNK